MGIPKSKGMFPTIPPGATEEEIKAIVAEHVDTEEHILRANTVETLLKNQIIKCVHDDYLCEIRHSIFDYERLTIHQIFDHLFENYGQLDLALKKSTMETFRSEPEWTKPIDRYFKRQQECRTIMDDSNVPIKDPIMVD